MDQENRMPLIGDKAPSFDAVTTQGSIKFPEDYAGKWVILFSHPADFTPVCTTEFMTFGSMIDEFKALNTELVGLSLDSKMCIRDRAPVQRGKGSVRLYPAPDRVIPQEWVGG